MNDLSSNSVSSRNQSLTAWLGAIRARSGDLSASEARVVALLEADPLFVCAATTAQVAARAGVSAPSVVRAARAIGFAGFTELKLEIARARGTTEFFTPAAELGRDASVSDVVDASVRAGAAALDALRGALDVVAFQRAIDVIRRADQVVVFGAGTSTAVAADAVFRLRAVGVRSVHVQDHESAMIATHLLTRSDAVITVSSTGRTSSTLSVGGAARDAGATLIAITNQAATPLADQADVVLTVGGAPLTSQMAASSSRLAQLVVIDALVATLALREPARVKRAEVAGIDLPDII